MRRYIVCNFCHNGTNLGISDVRGLSEMFAELLNFRKQKSGIYYRLY